MGDRELANNEAHSTLTGSDSCVVTTRKARLRDTKYVKTDKKTKFPMFALVLSMECPCLKSSMAVPSLRDEPAVPGPYHHRNVSKWSLFNNECPQHICHSFVFWLRLEDFCKEQGEIVRCHRYCEKEDWEFCQRSRGLECL